MDAEEFVCLAKDHRTWLRKSRNLLIAAKILREFCMGKLVEGTNLSARDIDQPLSEDDQFQIVDEAFFPAVDASQMLLGLAMENALKGRVLKNAPDKVQIKVVLNGQGKLSKAELIQVGTQLGKKGHDLVLLAELAGLEMNEQLHTALSRLTEQVLWEGRYPVPRRAAEEPKEAKEIRWAMGSEWDVVTPILDNILGEIGEE